MPKSNSRPLHSAEQIIDAVKSLPEAELSLLIQRMGQDPDWLLGHMMVSVGRYDPRKPEAILAHRDKGRCRQKNPSLGPSHTIEPLKGWFDYRTEEESRESLQKVQGALVVLKKLSPPQLTNLALHLNEHPDELSCGLGDGMKLVQVGELQSDKRFEQDLIQRLRSTASALKKHRNCAGARRKLTLEMRDAIDALFKENYLRGEIYEQMRDKHPKLIPGRAYKTNDGEIKKDEFMSQKNMWTSYKNAGGKGVIAITTSARKKDRALLQ